MKPTASALQTAAFAAESIRNSARTAVQMPPLRLPRQLDSWRPLLPYSREMAAGQAVLRDAEGGKWAGEVRRGMEEEKQWGLGLGLAICLQVKDAETYSRPPWWVCRQCFERGLCSCCRMFQH